MNETRHPCAPAGRSSGVAVVLVVVALAVPRLAAAQSGRSVEHYVEAVRAYHKGDSKRALSGFEAALKSDPGNDESRDLVARVYQEYAYKAHRDSDDVAATQFLKRGMELARTGETRLSLRRDYLRVAYLRVVARIKQGDLFSARRDEEELFEKAGAYLATDDSVYIVLRRLHEIVGGLTEYEDVFLDDRNEDIQVVLEGLEWRRFPRVSLGLARLALLGNEFLLARAFVDDAKKYDKEGVWGEAVTAIETTLRSRSLPLIIQSNATEFEVVLESTNPDVPWRGNYNTKAGEHEIRIAVLPGAYRLRCSKPGHTGLTQVIQLPPGSAGLQERCLLAAESRSITIDSPVPGERVRIDGISDQFSEVPFSVQLRPGDYTALVERTKGNQIQILKVPFSVVGDEERVVLNTTFGEVKLVCLGAPCDKNDFRVQTFEEGWLGAEQNLVQREKDTYLLPHGTYKITLVKPGYAQETHEVAIGPGDLEPEIFTLRATTRGSEEAETLRQTVEEAALPSLFRFPSRLTVGAGIAGSRMTVERTDGREVTREVDRVDVTLDYAYRFKLSGKRIPFLFFNGVFGLQPFGESTTISNLLSAEAFVGAGFYQRLRANVHGVFTAAYHLRYDQWDPKGKHLSALGAELAGLVDLAWFQQRIWARFDYGTGTVRMPDGRSTSSDQSQRIHVGAEAAADVLEAIVGDPLVDLYLGATIIGDYARERRDTDARLRIYNAMGASLFLRFEYRFDVGDSMRWVVGVNGRIHLLGPFVPELFLASQDKADASAAPPGSWSSNLWIGAEF